MIIILMDMTRYGGDGEAKIWGMVGVVKVMEGEGEGEE